MPRRLAIALAVLAVLAFTWWLEPSPARLIVVAEWLAGLGPVGIVAFTVLFFGWALLALPASWPQMIAGFLFGPLMGFLFASVAGTAAATLSFSLSRTRLRKTIESRVKGSARFRAIDSAIEEGGGQLVAILRLSPLSPFNIVSYVLGLTKVPTGPFIVGTSLGAIPPVALFTYLGSQVRDLTILVDGAPPTEQGWVQAVVLVTTVVATVLVTRFAQVALRRHLGPTGTPA